MRYFVVSHQPLEWALPAYMEPVSTVPCGERVTDLSTAHPGFAGRGTELSEYATLFALRRVLADSWGPTGPAAGEMLGVAHYRRYPVVRPIGIPDDVYGVVTPAEFEALGEEDLLPPPDTIVLPTVKRTNGVLRQYGQAHVARDLLHFMALAIDLGVIGDRAAASFLTQPLTVPACTIGIYPADWYVRVLGELERVVDAFQSTFASPREGYQSRAAAFCCERLHGMLLASLLVDWDADRVLINPAVIVSATGAYQPLTGSS